MYLTDTSIANWNYVIKYRNVVIKWLKRLPHLLKLVKWLSVLGAANGQITSLPATGWKILQYMTWSRCMNWCYIFRIFKIQVVHIVAGVVVSGCGVIIGLNKNINGEFGVQFTVIYHNICTFYSKCNTWTDLPGIIVIYVKSLHEMLKCSGTTHTLCYAYFCRDLEWRILLHRHLCSSVQWFPGDPDSKCPVWSHVCGQVHSRDAWLLGLLQGSSPQLWHWLLREEKLQCSGHRLTAETSRCLSQGSDALPGCRLSMFEW